MLTDQQVRKLMTLLQQGEPLYRAALKTGMDQSSARKYRQAGQLPSELKQYNVVVQADPGDEPAIKLYESLGTKEIAHHFDIPVADGLTAPHV